MYYQFIPGKRYESKQIYLTTHDSNLIDLRDISFEILIRKFGQSIIEKRKDELTYEVQESFNQNSSFSKNSLSGVEDSINQSGTQY